MLIGLSGYARSGKDTVAEYLVKEFNFTQHSFAEPIKKAMHTLNPVLDYIGENESYVKYRDVVDSMGLDAAKVEYPEIRRLLQVFGTEVGRSMFGENVWVDLCLNNIKSFHTVISDVRFLNEADAIKAEGGQVWRINRPEVYPSANHSSEVALDKYNFDQVIDNNLSIYALQEKVDIALGRMNI